MTKEQEFGVTTATGTWIGNSRKKWSIQGEPQILYIYAFQASGWPLNHTCMMSPESYMYVEDSKRLSKELKSENWTTT